MKPKKKEEKRSKVPKIIKDFYEIVALREAGWEGEPVRLSSGTVIHNPVVRKVISVDRWKKKQIDRAEAAKDDWLEGVKNPSRNPIEAAIAAKSKMIDRHAAAIKAGKWEKNLAKSSQAEIIAIASAVGPEGFAKGVRARETKIGRVVGELQPLAQSVSDAIQAMPDATDSDREKRLTTARKLMIEVGKKRIA